MRKTILISILAAWLVYFILPFEAPAIIYFIATICSTLLYKYVPKKWQLWTLVGLAVLVIVQQGYLLAGALTGSLVYVIINNPSIKEKIAFKKMSENKQILSLISVNTTIMVLVLVKKLMSGGF